MQTSFALGVLAALQLAGGLIGQLAVLRLVGIGAASDAYIAAQAVPVILAAVVAASLQSLWLPRFARLSEDLPALRHEQAIAQGQTLKVLLCIVAPLGATASFWSRWAFPGFTGEQLELVMMLSVPLLVGGVLNGQTVLLTAGLRARGRFLGPEITSLCGTLVLIALVFVLVPRYGIAAAPWITLGRAAGVYAVQLLQAGLPGIVLRTTPTSREVWRQLRPLIGGSMFIKTGPLVDRFWSSQAASGAVTTLNLAQLAMNSLASILERALLVRAVPEFARRLQKNDLQGLRRAYLTSLKQIGLAVCAVALTLLLLQPVWNSLLLIVLRVPAETAIQIWHVCLLLLPALFVSVAGSAAVAVFYAFGETRAPVVIGVSGFVASLFLKGLLFLYFGILGIAAGASLYLVLNMTLYHIAVSRRLSQATAAS